MFEFIEESDVGESASGSSEKNGESRKAKTDKHNIGANNIQASSKESVVSVRVRRDKPISATQSEL